MKWSSVFQSFDAVRRSQLGHRLIKNSSIISIGAAFTMGFGIVRTALITKHLTVYDFGLIGITLNLLTLLLLLLGIRINDLFYRFIPDFEQNNGKAAVGSLLFLGFSISLSIAVVASGILFFGRDWLASSVYGRPELASIFPVFALFAFFGAFRGYYESLLRLRDRFMQAVVPQVLGAGISVLVLSWLFFKSDVKPSLFSVSAVLVMGQVITCAPPMLVATWHERKYFLSLRNGGFFHPLSVVRKKIISTLFQTNLIGYLKLGANEGGILLLSIVGSPQQVAFITLAKQLVHPLVFLQGNLQQVLMPEVPSLFARHRLASVKKVIEMNFGAFFVVGLLMFLALWIVIDPLILIVSTAEYLPAGPLCLLLFIVVWSQALTMPFFPLALAMDRLWFRNIVVMIRYVYLAIAFQQGLTALSLVWVQLAGSATTRVLNDIPLYLRLRRMVGCQSKRHQDLD